MDKIQFLSLINRLKIKRDFFLAYCHEFLQRDPPGSQNRLDFIRDVGQLDFEHISDNLAAYIASEGCGMPDCQKLLEHFGKFGSKAEPKGDAFDLLINNLKVSPGYHAAQAYCIEMIGTYPDGSPWDMIVNDKHITSTTMDNALKRWFETSPYKNNPNVQKMINRYPYLIRPHMY